MVQELDGVLDLKFLMMLWCQPPLLSLLHPTLIVSACRMQVDQKSQPRLAQLRVRPLHAWAQPRLAMQLLHARPLHIWAQLRLGQRLRVGRLR